MVLSVNVQKILCIIEISNDKFVCVLELTSFSSLFNDSIIILVQYWAPVCKHGHLDCPKIPGQEGMSIFLKYLSLKSSKLVILLNVTPSGRN